MAKKDLEQDIADFLKNRFRSPNIKDYNEHLLKLKELYDALDVHYDLKKGDYVIWKKGLKNKARPAEYEPVIIVDILEEPLYDTDRNAGSPYFKEPLDLILGMIDPDGDFMMFYYDKRRFQPYQMQ